MDERYTVAYIGGGTPDVQAVVDRCLDIGLTLTEDGRTDVCEECVVRPGPGEFEVLEDVPLEPAIEQLEGAHAGSLKLWYEQSPSTHLTVGFQLDQDRRWNDGPLRISFQTLPLDPGGELDPEFHAASKIQTRVSVIVDLIATLAECYDPEYAWGMLGTGQRPGEGLRPTGRPISEHVDELGWVTVLSEPLVDAFGGRERVLDTPAWKVQELETGHVVIVKTDNPVEPTDVPSISSEEYLLEGRSREELKADLLAGHDPFLDIAPGEYGSDVVLEPAAVGGDVTNEDLELVRVECGSDNCLWDANTGEFVRRLVDGPKDPIGNLPAEIDSEDEMYTACYLWNIPVEFVRLADPDDENVVTKVMRLDVDIYKGQLLTGLAEVLASGELDLATIERAIDKLHEVEDPKAAERWIEQRLF